MYVSIYAMSNRGWGISGACSTLACDPDLASQALPQHKDDLEVEGTKGNEAVQERWIENQVKLRARLLLEVGLYIHEEQ